MTEQQEIIREGVRSPTEGEMQWKTVEKQKEKLGEALKITMTGHLTGKNGKILEVGKEIMSVCDQAGIKGDMRYSLAKVLLEAAKASEEKEEKLRRELDGANILEKRGVKDRIKEEEEKRARLAAWGISCQGLEHWMRESVEEEGKLRLDCLPHPQPTAPLFSVCPPPYFGNYPMLSIKDGSMENEDGVVLRLTGGQVECEYEEQHRPRPQQQMITIGPEKTAPPAAQVQTHLDHKEEEDEEGEEERSSAAGATARSPPELLAGEAERLVEMLPPIIDGGAGWLRQLDKVTSGTQLALGDFRAIAGRCMTVTALEEIQVLAAVITRPDSTPFFRVQEQIGNAVRQQYPTPNAAAITKLEWKPDQNPRDYVEQVKEKWIQNTGYNPSARGLHQVWFRKAVLEGIPEKVREKILDVPDLEGADTHRWERHLVHYLDKYKQGEDKKKGELEEIQEQLLKLNLGEAKQKVSEKKKENKLTDLSKVMVAQDCPPVPKRPEFNPNIYPMNSWTHYDGLQSAPMASWGGNVWAGRGRARGRGGSVGARGTWGYGRGAPGAGRGPRGVCWVCYQPGHWAKDCPQQPQIQQQMVTPQAGRGGPYYQAPNPHMIPGPRPQMPTWEAGWNSQDWQQRHTPQGGRGEGGKADPLLSLTVNGLTLPFLVDMGATYSTIQEVPDNTKLSGDEVSVVGFSGVSMTLPVTVPLKTEIGKQAVAHPYVISAQVPVNLMGRDLLIKLGAVIMCGPDGLTVTLKDGTQLPCVATGTRGQWLLSEDIDRTAEIYWARLTTSNGILAHFQLWLPWIMALDVYAPPIDPYHVTLFYDRENTEWYEDLFHEFLEGKAWQVSTRDIYVGPQGVAALVHLSEEQKSWFRMGDESVPHVSLAVHSGHQAKDLGPMMRVASRAIDWQLTQIPDVSFSPSTKTYRISTPHTDDTILEHRHIRRTHGRELTDHPEVVKGLSQLPHTVVTGAYGCWLNHLFACDL
ncbi:uncharacterized protein LOC109195047 [Oreochromis niloticus]|uniref:uncharacterized protein LOC109195047 n=1 Tax=Oreochromis niloticus TaxID=8128 RepID=UPI000905AF05|nr:uncharacterized protein LOC109195047 [Oreochromis niloticus]XP_025755269.1 uncharacterized protein LOC109195047 [Oreochromis niloticus]